MPCAKCGFKNPPAARFCQECGASLEPGFTSEPQVAAPTTGGQPSLSERQSLQPHEVLDGERKTGTALFADIKSSAELMADLDPKARAIIEPAPPLPARIGWLAAVLVIFLANCAMSLVLLFFIALAGRSISILFGSPGFLLPFVLSGGLSALVSLAVLVPLRRRAPELFWVGGIAVAVLVVPTLSVAFRGVLTYAEGNVQLGQMILRPMLTSNVKQWFYPLLHFPANLIVAVRSAVLLALVAWLWPAQWDTGYYLHGPTQ